ncbi:putative FMN-dependent luciferase-like monooxygenase [Ensifer sp. T173]|uniref:FMN-dependent luciferase-like monooxygenase n=1 Tax=Ensifer canadensis TaxID=555315 RepID=A0AAW4FQZ5_9HYPH|nr:MULTISPECIES: putative FMN-dependent luciferase-like monooxygenase [Ensifer]MBD9491458.1 putative FMN-dependent luciferase-like monooxygenase [Ensifer sp. ENS11]MBM3093734.1 putative FMN-dependent luciferase-like monooxygenase [Ensifer canadensis]MDP9633611.1 putative FMN-dependent luciferase-like monooxygenase [Ensifer adhaerens]UBI77728.1 putative FMN-dependent luciferase-like monooxygenase [Ensifer canadensis]
MTNTTPRKRLGFFTRLLDDVPAGTRYHYAAEQIATAERFGFDTAWVAQHHFHADEGGLPAPLVFLAHVAAQTSRIRLGTGVITLPLENPIRVAEDAAVLDLLSCGRVEIGFGTGGTPSSFTAFGLESAERGDIFARHLRVVLDAWAGRSLSGGDQLYPTAPQLLNRIWQATFSVAGGERAGRAGDGLMLSRTQPRTAERPDASLAELQNPIIDAYLAGLPAGRAPRILGSRSLFVADSRAEALRLAEIGLRRGAERLVAAGHKPTGNSLAELIAAFDVHVGTPDHVIESLRADTTLDRVTDLVFQVHSIDPPHPLILRSIELIATKVAPALGWAPEEKFAPRRLGAVG